MEGGNERKKGRMGKGKGWMWIGREGDIQGRRKVGTGKIERERGI